jgi:hypothetical protein
MIFILTIRPVAEGDLSPSTPFLPENDEYDIYLLALFEDLKQISVIKMVTPNNSSFSIETVERLSLDKLKKLIKSLFTEDLKRYIRFVSLVKL